MTQRSYPGALFFAAGEYHHHVAVNVWAHLTAAPAGSVGLVSYRFQVPCAEILYCLSHRAPLVGYETQSASAQDGGTILQIRDPNGAWLEVQPSVAATASGPASHSGASNGTITASVSSQGTKRMHQESKLSYDIKSNG